MLRRRLLGTLGLVGCASLAWLGCESKKTTEIVAGVSTQVKVPRDLRQVRIDVNVGGANVFCRAYQVFDGKVQLPKTLGNLPANDATQPITVSISGYTSAVEADVDCLNPPKVETGSDGAPRILRRSRQPYATDRVLFLPMPMRYSCFDVPCDDPQGTLTCKAGRCVDAATDPNSLQEYDDELILGNSSTCFNTGVCMREDLQLEAWPVDEATCLFAVPGSTNAPPAPEGVTAPPAGPGLNVRVVYDGGFSREILDLDAQEGFIVPDPTKPQQFQLAPALCDLYHGVDTSLTPPQPTAHRIVGVEVNSVCQPKTPLQAICAADQVALMTNGGAAVEPGAECKNGTLKPSSNGIIVLADNSTRMKEFYIAATSDAPLGDAGTKAAAKSLSEQVALTLKDPSLQVTQLGFAFIPRAEISTCNEVNATLPYDVAPDLADVSAPKIDAAMKLAAAALGGSPPAATPLELQKGLIAAYRDLKTNPKFTGAAKRAVLVLANRELLVTGGANCTDPLSKTVADAKAAGIQTYLILVGKNPSDNSLVEAESFLGVGECNASNANAHCADGRGSAGQGALNKYYDLVGQVAGCLYDPPAGYNIADKAELAATQIAFHATVAIPKDVKVSFNENASDPAGGFRANNGKIEIFGPPCDDLRQSLKTTGFFSIGFGQKAPGVPVFFEKKCK